ncbi:MAG: quinoprotein dehydrogenase-associated putative ABC transporter substrate-binding protein [Burkholderiales bacterium]|nr:quinoprotein dehydrogenase-associated putative ABC transporter substrate-binding protein [Burkholderiales bacterium]
MRTRHLMVLLLAVAMPLSAVPARADEPVPRKAFRVCSDPSNLPFSDRAGDGYENRIAELFAQSLQLPVEYFFLAQRMNFVRNSLRFKLPGEDFPCDIIMGVPEGFGQVATTHAYFRSTHTLVYVKGRRLDGVRSVADFLALGESLRSMRIGVYDRSPASEWLARHGLVDSGIPYRMLNADPDFHPSQILERDLVDGTLDAAIVWGPVAGYAAKRITGAELVVIAMPSEPGVRFDFAVAMGVRHGETDWKAQIDALITANEARITEILDEYGIPRVAEGGAALR